YCRSAFHWSCDSRHLHSFPTRRSSDLSGFRQPPSEESSLAGAVLPIYLSLLSWSGCDQQCCRASFATAGGGAQELGWESNRKRRSEEHTSELQSRSDLVCRLLLENKNQ